MTERCPTCKRAMPRAIPKRRAKPRRGPMRDPKYRRWLKVVPACAAGLALLSEGKGFPCEGHNDPAHTQNNGMRSKGPDSTCAPLCRKHHIEYDAGRAAFEKKYGISMKASAAEHYARYQKEQEK